MAMYDMRITLHNHSHSLTLVPNVMAPGCAPETNQFRPASDSPANQQAHAFFSRNLGLS